MGYTHQQETDVFLADISQRLSELRVARGLTQAQLADQAGLGLRTVQRLEDGAASNLSAFIAVCRVLGILGQIDAAIPRPVASPISQLEARRTQGRLPTRVRPKRKQAAAKKKTWTWGDD